MAQRRNDSREKTSEFIEEVIAIDRVVRVVKGGRRFRFRATVVVGDGKQRVGIGVSKGADVQIAITKAVADAKKNMISINIQGDSIPHEVLGRQSASKVMLKPAFDGTGLIAGGTVRSVLDVTGIKNVLSKSLGSSNKLNVAHATIDALKQLESRDNWITTSNTSTQASKNEEAA